MSLLKILLILFGFFFAFNCRAQTSFSTQYIEKISIRLKDSLELSREQLKEIYRINQTLENEKTEAWKKYSDDNDIRQGLQAIENKRDSLYNTVFTKRQFIIYKEKKAHLLNSN